MPAKFYSSDVFINCPFDEDYTPLFHAMIFCVFDCGFRARSAQEVEDGSEVRLNKIERIIGECKFSIHDISRVELNHHSLPRFNMPFELGLFLGAKRFGKAPHTEKQCMILDRQKFRYQKFLSDIAGQDIQSHQKQPKRIIICTRNFLNGVSGRKTIPGGEYIFTRYQKFKKDLPKILMETKLTRDELGFNEFCTLASNWARETK